MTASTDRRTVIYAPDDIRGRIIRQRLAVAGLPAEHTRRPYELFQLLQKGARPGLVIADISGREMEERNIILDLVQRCSPIPAMLVTGPRGAVGLDQRLSRCRGLFQGVVAGPFDPDRIYATARQLLDGHRTADGAGSTMAPTGNRPPVLSHRISTRIRGVVRGLLRAAILPGALLLGLAGGYAYWCIASLPDIDRLSSHAPYMASALFSYDNRKLSEFYIQRRAAAPLERIPETVQDAFLTIEDARFFDHHGIDLIRTAGALWADIRSRAFVQGGSTITQQLAKMLFLTPDKTITRKLQEMVIAIRLEKEHTKREILERYLNQAYFGTRAYGIEAAARTYLGKSVEELTLAEGALLAGLIKAPSRYSPFKNSRLAKNRRNHVLHRMWRTGKISKTAYTAAMRTPVPQEYRGKRYNAPYFVEHCRRILENRYGQRLYTSGFQVFTTLDYRLQQLAEKAVQNGVQAVENRNGRRPVQAALLAMELTSGRILAMVGGRDFWQSQFNRATQAKRQPGSAFKPVVYLTALEKGLHPETLVTDEPVAIRAGDSGPVWAPTNYDGRIHGSVPLEQALARSYNLATVHLARTLGLENITRTARRIGITSRIQPYYPSALGASELPLIELVTAYATLASGVRTSPRVIDQVIDGESLKRWSPPKVAEPVISETVRAEIRQMLRKVITDGTGRKALAIDRDVFGKTGTTNDCADALFIGFDDRMAVGVWVGRDSRSSLGRKETGSRAALPIWVSFMQAAGKLRFAPALRAHRPGLTPARPH
jgi:penicillin-binding protein 1A